MDREYSVSGKALTGELLEARPVTVYVKNGIITAIDDEKNVPDRWICPAFFNSHTHIADTLAMDIPCSGSLEDLVTPPGGLKHRILENASHYELIDAMHRTMSEMIAGGTAGFADFREGGPEGVVTLNRAAQGLPIKPVILGRSGGELVSEGVGISSTRDERRCEEIIEAMKKAGKIISLHAGEKDSDDIDDALSYNPDLLIHCTHAKKSQLKQIADAGIPVAVCCRSNFLLGVSNSSRYPPLKEMLDAGIKILIGTDNAMFVQPDMMQEISFIHTLYGIPERELLKSAVSGFPPAGVTHLLNSGNKACFFILDASWGNIGYSHDIISTIVKRAPIGHICARIF